MDKPEDKPIIPVSPFPASIRTDFDAVYHAAHIGQLVLVSFMDKKDSSRVFYGIGIRPAPDARPIVVAVMGYEGVGINSMIARFNELLEKAGDVPPPEWAKDAVPV